MTPASSQVFSRQLSILLLLCVGCSFASAHIAARISFDHGTGLLTAVFFRSGLSLLLLGTIALWHRKSLRLSWQLAPWQLALGLLIAIQSVSIYSAVSRIPVGIALLVVNTFPAQLALVTWALGGGPPSRKASVLMAIILIGLLLALDIPSLMQTDVDNIQLWVTGIGFGLLAAFSFAVGLWITEHKLLKVEGSTRSFYTMLTVLMVSMAVSRFEFIPGGLTWPESVLGWGMLFLLSGLYATGFITIFMLAPRLNLSQNAPAMNIEPVASMSLGWLILGQQLNAIQIIGGAIVVSCIVAFSYAKS